MIETLAAQQNVTDVALIELAKEVSRNRENDPFGKLAKEIAAKHNGELTPKQKESVQNLVLGAEKDAEMEDFRAKVLTNNSDFAGWDITTGQVESNEVYQEVIKAMDAFGQFDFTWPSKFYAEWFRTALGAMTKEIQSYSAVNIGSGGSGSGTMTKNDVANFISKLNDAHNSGVGRFEDWFKAKDEAQYTEWKNSLDTSRDAVPTASKQPTELDLKKLALAEKLTAAKTQCEDLDKFPKLAAVFAGFETSVQNVDTMGKLPTETEIEMYGEYGRELYEAHEKAGEVATRFDALVKGQAGLAVDEKINAEVRDLQGIIAGSDGTDPKVDFLQDKVKRWDDQVTAAENVIEALKTSQSKLGPEQINPIILEILKGEIDEEKAREKLGLAKKEAAAEGGKPATGAAKESEPPAPWEDEDDSTLGSWLASAKQIPNEAGAWGKLRAMAIGLVMAIAGLVARFAKNSWTSKYVRDSIISSKMLADPPFNDAIAKLAVIGKKRLRQETGLLPDTMKKLNGMTVKDFVADFRKKPDEFTKDPGQNERLVFLCSALEARAGGAKDKLLYEVIGAKADENIFVLPDVKYKAMTPAAAPVVTAAPATAGPAQAATSQPALAAAEAPAVGGVPSPTAAVLGPVTPTLPGAQADKDPTAKR